MIGWGVSGRLGHKIDRPHFYSLELFVVPNSKAQLRYFRDEQMTLNKGFEKALIWLKKMFLYSLGLNE